MLPYCIPPLYDALPAPNNPASCPLSRPGAAIPLPAANVLSGVSPARHIPQPTPNQKPRLEQVQPRPQCCCTLTKRGFSIRSHLVTPPRVETPLIKSAAKPPSPAANVLSGVSGLRRATGRCLTQKPRLAPVKPCGAGGWRLVGIAKPQPGFFGWGWGQGSTRALRARPPP